MRRSEIINWYLKEIEADIESVEELADKKALVEKIIDRLMHHVSTNSNHGNDDITILQDRILLPLVESHEVSESHDPATSEDDDPYLVVHPNYIIS